MHTCYRSGNNKNGLDFERFIEILKLRWIYRLITIFLKYHLLGFQKKTKIIDGYLHCIVKCHHIEMMGVNIQRSCFGMMKELYSA